MQKRLLKINPITGGKVQTSLTAEECRVIAPNSYWRFNPWTGAERAAEDVKSDPLGLLIYDGESPVGAFKQEASRRNADHIVRAAAGDTPAAAREALHDWAEREALHDWAERNPGAAEAMTVANEVADKLFGPTDPPRDKAHNPSYPYKQNIPPAADPLEVQTFGPLKDTLDTTLADRGAKYGKFTDHAAVTQSLKYTMYNQPKWEKLTDDQKEALEMIAHKIGRILNGDPNYADSWIDIAGYAKLVADRLDGVAK